MFIDHSKLLIDHSKDHFTVCCEMIVNQKNVFLFAVINLQFAVISLQFAVMSHNKGRDFLDFDFYCLLNMLLEYEF